MHTFIVEYTFENCGGQTMQMEIDAPNLETVYEIVNAEYPNAQIEQVVPNRT